MGVLDHIYVKYSKKLTFIVSGILLSVLCTRDIKAQNKIIDSLVKLLPATKLDTNRVILLNKIGMALYSTDYQKALNYCEQARTLSIKLKYTRGLALNSHIQGVVYTFKDDYSTALIKEQQAASLALKINDFLLLAKAYNAAGLAYSRLNDSTRSMAAFKDAIQALTRTSDKSYNAAILHNVAVLYIDKKQYQRGLNDLFTAADLNLRNKNNQWLVQNYFWIGKVYYMQKQYPLALKYEGLAIAIANQYQFYQPLVKALGVEGNINIALKKYRIAESDLLQAEKIAVDKKIASEQTAILKSLADMYEQEHNLKMALAYQKKYHAAYEAVFNAAKAKLVAEYQAKFQDKQKFIENELLKKDSAISQANIKQRNLQLMITLLIILALVISIGMICWTYFKIKKKNQETEYQNQQIAKQNARLEDLSQLKDKLFSVLAHDLRGPLATIKSLLLMYDQGIIDVEEGDMIRKSIVQKVDQNSDVINNLLVWGRSHLNGFMLAPLSFSVFDLVAQIIEQLKSDSDDKSIAVINKIEPGLNAYADLEMMHTVVRNLLNNAVKFTPEKGSVTITAINTDNEVTVTIKDTGIGIPPQQVDRLFKGDFYTTKTTINPHGTGLGLQICKEFIEQNNGKIWVESEEGKGSSFIFSMPAKVT